MHKSKDHTKSEKDSTDRPRTCSYKSAVYLGPTVRWCYWWQENIFPNFDDVLSLYLILWINK